MNFIKLQKVLKSVQRVAELRQTSQIDVEIEGESIEIRFQDDILHDLTKELLSEGFNFRCIVIDNELIVNIIV